MKTVGVDVSSLRRREWLHWQKLFAYSGAYLRKYACAYNLTWQRTFMLEFYVRSISPLHSKDFQLLCSSYIGLHKFRTPYACPLSINLSLMKYWRKKIIILDAETWNLPTHKLQQVNVYGTRNNFKKDIWLHFNCEIYFPVHVFYTCKLVKCHYAAFHQGMHGLLRLKNSQGKKYKI